jgi:hypothetical protein
VRWVLTLSPGDFRFARSRWSCPTPGTDKDAAMRARPMYGNGLSVERRGRREAGGFCLLDLDLQRQFEAVPLKECGEPAFVVVIL